MVIGWFMLFIIMWTFGYTQTRFFIHPMVKARLIKIPRVIYYLFGRPKTKTIPENWVGKGAAIAQTQAYLFLFYGVFCAPFIDLPIGAHLSIALIESFILSFLVVHLITIEDNSKQEPEK